MFEEENEIHLCYSCDAEFSVNAITDEDKPLYCPFCACELIEEEDPDYDVE
jgi:uncharacterized paraquat-inducible protein A